MTIVRETSGEYGNPVDAAHPDALYARYAQAAAGLVTAQLALDEVHTTRAGLEKERERQQEQLREFYQRGYDHLRPANLEATRQLTRTHHRMVTGRESPYERFAELVDIEREGLDTQPESWATAIAAVAILRHGPQDDPEVIAAKTTHRQYAGRVHDAYFDEHGRFMQYLTPLIHVNQKEFNALPLLARYDIGDLYPTTPPVWIYQLAADISTLPFSSVLLLPNPTDQGAQENLATVRLQGHIRNELHRELERHYRITQPLTQLAVSFLIECRLMELYDFPNAPERLKTALAYRANRLFRVIAPDQVPPAVQGIYDTGLAYMRELGLHTTPQTRSNHLGALVGKGFAGLARRFSRETRTE